MKAFFLATALWCFGSKMALLSSLLTFWGFWLSVFFSIQPWQQQQIRRNCMYAAGSPPLQPTRAAQLLLDGVKIEPCTKMLFI
jgi:hypothetical protein